MKALESSNQVRVLIDRIARQKKKKPPQDADQGLEHVTDVVYRLKG